VIKLGVTGILHQLGLLNRNPLPVQGQQPNRNQTHNTTNGKVVRVYGSDGRATHDIDYGDQSHSGWGPGGHDWDWSSGKPVRQAPRQPTPADFPPGVPTTWP
jgi:hypothetical protein